MYPHKLQPIFFGNYFVKPLIQYAIMRDIFLDGRVRSPTWKAIGQFYDYIAKKLKHPQPKSLIKNMYTERAMSRHDYKCNKYISIRTIHSDQDMRYCHQFAPCTDTGPKTYRFTCNRGCTGDVKTCTGLLQYIIFWGFNPLLKNVIYRNGWDVAIGLCSYLVFLANF